MKSIPWVLIAAGAAVAAYVFFKQPGVRYASGSDEVEDAADKTALWGSKQRLSGVGTGLIGRVKEGIGRVTGDDDLTGDGVVDQVVGKAKDAAGGIAQAAGSTMHELNK
jgi:uncharacterized protein YjbJ (UPF0337 family)